MYNALNKWAHAYWLFSIVVISRKGAKFAYDISKGTTKWNAHKDVLCGLNLRDFFVNEKRNSISYRANHFTHGLDSNHTTDFTTFVLSLISGFQGQSMEN